MSALKSRKRRNENWLARTMYLKTQLFPSLILLSLISHFFDKSEWLLPLLP